MKTMQTYTTLDGRVLDLTDLTEEERDFFGRCLADYRAGVAWERFARLVEGPENPLIRAAGRVTQAVWNHPLYQAVRDLEDRLGIQQGHLAPGPDDDPFLDPLEDEWIPAAQAAASKGVTMPGLHKAINRGDVIARPAKPGGSWLLVSVRSLRRWQPNPVRQAARRRIQ